MKNAQRHSRFHHGTLYWILDPTSALPVLPPARGRSRSVSLAFLGAHKVHKSAKFTLNGLRTGGHASVVPNSTPAGRKEHSRSLAGGERSEPPDSSLAISRREGTTSVVP